LTICGFVCRAMNVSSTSHIATILAPGTAATPVTFSVARLATPMHATCSMSLAASDGRAARPLKTPPDRPAKPAESVVTAVRRETKLRVAMMNLLDENVGWNP
jgi:hypothetical protein